MVNFDILEKVAIVTGGASGIGLGFVLELLKKGAKGVTIADIATENAQKVIKDIEHEFGTNKAIFIKTDVSNQEQFEEAFRKTKETFQNIDILINNAGFFSDVEWQRELDVNTKGPIIGTLLALENYIQKYKSGTEGVIVNIASVAGIAASGGIPMYSATKFAVHGLTLAFGSLEHYKRTGVRVVGICPGGTITPMKYSWINKCLGPAYEKLWEKEYTGATYQSVEEAAPCFIGVIEEAPPGTIWVVEGGETYQYQMPDRFTIPKIRL